MFGLAQRTGRLLTLEIALRRQHYVQALAQGVFLVYWGVVLASRLRLRLPDCRTAGVRLRLRYVALLVTA